MKKKWKLFGAACTLSLMTGVLAAPINGPIMVIGGSLENGKTPCEIGKVNVLGCISIGFGNYLSLGQAITHSNLGNGVVFNEAMAGATTFDRPGYIIPGEALAEIGWENDGYSKQLTRALAQVTDPFTGTVNAHYVVIGIANDCLHSNAFATAPSQSVQCSTADLDALVTRYIQVGQEALAAGVTPVYTLYPPRKTSGTIGWDLALSQQVLGFAFVISDANYDYLATKFKKRIRNELPEAIRVNAWKDIIHFGDGLHPTMESTTKAARRVMKAISEDSSY